MAQPEFMNRLTAENIFVSVGRKEILKGVAISAAQGKITGLLGRNGSGKSTLLRTIFGTQKSDDQNIQVKGRSIQSAYKVGGAAEFSSITLHAAGEPGNKDDTRTLWNNGRANSE